MNTTNFQTPTTLNSVLAFNSIINQFSIPWNYNPNTLGENAYAVTARPLYTMSGFWQEKFQSSTDQLWCTGFNIPYTQVGYQATFTQDIYGNTQTGAAGLDSTYIELESHSVMTSLFDTSTYYGNRHYTLYNPITVTYADGQQQTVTYVRCTNATSNGVVIGLESTAGHNFPITIQTSNYDPLHSVTISGIELELDIKRAARIEDLVIQLTLGGVLIGNNLASSINPVQADMYTAERANYPTPVPDYSIYGGSTNMWGTTLTSNQIADPTFGVVVSFQSNVIYPHKDLAYLHKARLRVTYA